MSSEYRMVDRDGNEIVPGEDDIKTYKPWQDPDVVDELYHGHSWSTNDIGRAFGVGGTAIRRMMAFHDIDARENFGWQHYAAHRTGWLHICVECGTRYRTRREEDACLREHAEAVVEEVTGGDAGP